MTIVAAISSDQRRVADDQLWLQTNAAIAGEVLGVNTRVVNAAARGFASRGRLAGPPRGAAHGTVGVGIVHLHLSPLQRE